MTDTAGDRRSWFVVLPDCESACDIAALLRVTATRQVSHPSGNPWLLGRWPEDLGIVVRARDAHVAVIGQHQAAPERLHQAADRLRTIADVDPLRRSLSGSFHLIASVGGQVRVQGTLSSHRRVFHTRINGLTVAADQATALARLLDAAVDEQRLAVCLLDPSALHPVTGQPVWRGIDVVPADQYLRLDRDGRHHAIRWWRPPENVVPMSVGAPAFGEALAAAVDVRVGGRAVVTTDLGGLDSTSVTSLAARRAATVVAYTITNGDPGDDELRWARRTVTGLGNVEHHVIPADEMPITYDRLLDLNVATDEPCIGTVDLARFLIIPRRAVVRGSTLHLTGFGGDELLSGSPAHLKRMMRTDPKVALRHLRGFAVKGRWSYREALRQLADTQPYSAWLDAVADNLTAPPATGKPPLGWGIPPRLPPWATPDAASAVRNLIAAEARDVEPLAPDRGSHVELEMVRSVSRIVAQLAEMAAGVGITVAAPFHDDRVIEAGLAVQPKDRVTPWRYKPLIAEAMVGVVPADSLARQTKSDGSCDEDTGLRKNRGDLLSLFDGSRLARLGLVDENALREACRRPAPLPEHIGLLYQTVACEVWLRSLDRAPVPDGVRL